MIKTFEMKVTFDTVAQKMTTETSASENGFSPIEMLGILELKRQDILMQIYNPNDFKRTLNCEDGHSDEIVYKGDE